MTRRLYNRAYKHIKEMLKLKRHGLHVGFYDWLDKRGVEMFAPLKRPQIRLDFEPHQKQCYANSQRLVCYNDWENVKYYEGYATNEKLGDMAFEHGWNMINGEVVDLTWEDGVDYFGVEIPTEMIRERWVKTGKAESLLILLYQKETKK